MKYSAVLVLGGVAMILIEMGLGVAAGENKKIPLSSVYTTTGQKDTRDAVVELREVSEPFGEFSGLPVIFLVNGKDFLAAVKVSRPFLEFRGDGKKPDPKAESKATGLNWVGACMGSEGSLPPAFRVLAVEIEGKKIRVTYESIKNDLSSGDEHPYLLWAPLGKLSAGEYTLELYDATVKKVTASRKSKVVE
jgi:hypothetical protein